MGINYTFSFFDAEGKTIGGGDLERHYTHYPAIAREFWSSICYSETPKKEFAEKFMEKISACDVNSEDYQVLASAFGHLVGHDGWCTAVIIGVSCH